MKKILNNPLDYVDEMLEGLVAAHPGFFRRVGDGRVIARADGPIKGKVGIVSGGGSGHLPLFTGYVGRGLLDACAIGDVFASPTSEQMAEAMRQANGGAGVLRLYGNYGGDVMNFDMAGDLVEMEGVDCATVAVADDVVSAPPEEQEKRRGTGALIYGFKIAGAAAERGDNLEEVTRVARKATDSCRSVGMALTSCTVPQAGKPTFEIAPDEMEMGMGIHGEPGVWRGKLKPADEIADEMLDMLLKDRPLSDNGRVSISLNSFGATPLEELYIVYRRVQKRLSGEGARILLPLVGRYATSMEMTGMTMTLCHLDDELEALLGAPCDCPFWRIS